MRFDTKLLYVMRPFFEKSFYMSRVDNRDNDTQKNKYFDVLFIIINIFDSCAKF